MLQTRVKNGEEGGIVDERAEHMFFNGGFSFLGHRGNKVLMKGDGVFSEDIHDLVPVRIQEATIVLTVVDIEHPMHGFDSPMISHKLKYACGRGV